MITLTMRTEDTPKMIINNPEGIGTVKNGEDEQGLQTMNLKNLGLLFKIHKQRRAPVTPSTFENENSLSFLSCIHASLSI